MSKYFRKKQSESNSYAEEKRDPYNKPPAYQSLRSSQEGSIALFSQRTPSFVQKMRESKILENLQSIQASGGAPLSSIGKIDRLRSKHSSNIFQSQESMAELTLKPLGQIPQPTELHPVSTKN
jgi:hypothetical protein